MPLSLRSYNRIPRVLRLSGAPRRTSGAPVVLPVVQKKATTQQAFKQAMKAAA